MCPFHSHTFKYKDQSAQWNWSVILPAGKLVDPGDEFMNCCFSLLDIPSKESLPITPWQELREARLSPLKGQNPRREVFNSLLDFFSTNT
jgi:hypothetical protein